MQTVLDNINYDVVNGHEVEIRVHRGATKGQGNKYIQRAKGLMVKLVKECEPNSISFMERSTLLDDGTVIVTRLNYGAQRVSIYPVDEEEEPRVHGFAVPDKGLLREENESNYIKLAIKGEEFSYDYDFDSPPGVTLTGRTGYEWHSTDWSKQTIIMSEAGSRKNCAFGLGVAFVLVGRDKYEEVDTETNDDAKVLRGLWYTNGKLMMAKSLNTATLPDYSGDSIVIYAELFGGGWREAGRYETLSRFGAAFGYGLLARVNSAGTKFMFIDHEDRKSYWGDTLTHQNEVTFNLAYGTVLSIDVNKRDDLHEFTRSGPSAWGDSTGVTYWEDVFKFCPEFDEELLSYGVQPEEVTYFVYGGDKQSFSESRSPYLYEWITPLEVTHEIVDNQVYRHSPYVPVRTKDAAISQLEYWCRDYDPSVEPGFFCYSATDAWLPIPEMPKMNGFTWIYGMTFTDDIIRPGYAPDTCYEALGYRWMWAYWGFPTADVMNLTHGQRYRAGVEAWCDGASDSGSDLCGKEIIGFDFLDGSDEIVYHYTEYFGNYTQHSTWNGPAVGGDSTYDIVSGDPYKIRDSIYVGSTEKQSFDSDHDAWRISPTRYPDFDGLYYELGATDLRFGIFTVSAHAREKLDEVVAGNWFTVKSGSTDLYQNFNNSAELCSGGGDYFYGYPVVDRFFSFNSAVDQQGNVMLFEWFYVDEDSYRKGDSIYKYDPWDSQPYHAIYWTRIFNKNGDLLMDTNQYNALRGGETDPDEKKQEPIVPFHTIPV